MGKDVIQVTEEKIREIMKKFTLEAKKVYDTTLRSVILYGSCARGDFDQDSDIDILILLDVPQEELNVERKKILDVSERLDWDYDVVLTPVLQNYQLYQKYLSVSKFYQNVQREGVRYA
jgi:predicted nucleotidyltransferase